MAPTARAEPAPDAAKAEALFREATRLLATSNVETACARFAESKRLEPGIGVTLYLGECYERLGRTASAWGEFTAAEDMARRARDPRARVAHDRAARLEPRLAKLALVIEDGAPLDGLEVREDGVVVGAAQLGVALPVDPGEHHVEASAPHRKSWEHEVLVSSGPGTVTVEVPRLEARIEAARPSPSAESTDPPPPSAEAGDPPETASTGDGQRVAGLVTAAVGVVGLGVGTVFGLVAKSKLDDSNANGCNARDQCDASGLSLRSAGLQDATISTVAFASGGAALVGGVLLYLTAPRTNASPALEVRGSAARGGGEIVLRGRF